MERLRGRRHRRRGWCCVDGFSVETMSWPASSSIALQSEAAFPLRESHQISEEDSMNLYDVRFNPEKFAKRLLALRNWDDVDFAPKHGI
ncbi:hypothetical protein [Caballeronia sp. RCC_10]|uniref:hypothetical protein n=1 Tax=Caballeronia sp. RCC_10 TaxID=3239227 RepID=UPI0035234FA7